MTDKLIQLHHIVPDPLRESALIAPSEIWASDVEFAIDERHLVTAPSGTGKSTFLHILYGLRRDFTGEANILGRPLSSLTASDWAILRSHHLSIIFQDLRLFLSYSVAENIEIKRALTDHVSAVRAREMVDTLGIGHLWDQKAETLSYGQRQRVAIVRALCQPFDVLLLDEPFSHLDKDNIALASSLIQQTCEENQAGMIMVSLGEAYSFSYHQQHIL